MGEAYELIRRGGPSLSVRLSTSHSRSLSSQPTLLPPGVHSAIPSTAGRNPSLSPAIHVGHHPLLLSQPFLLSCTPRFAFLLPGWAHSVTISSPGRPRGTSHPSHLHYILFSGSCRAFIPAAETIRRVDCAARPTLSLLSGKIDLPQSLLSVSRSSKEPTLQGPPLFTEDSSKKLAS